MSLHLIQSPEKPATPTPCNIKIELDRVYRHHTGYCVRVHMVGMGSVWVRRIFDDPHNAGIIPTLYAVDRMEFSPNSRVAVFSGREPEIVQTYTLMSRLDVWEMYFNHYWSKFWKA